MHRAMQRLLRPVMGVVGPAALFPEGQIEKRVEQGGQAEEAGDVPRPGTEMVHEAGIGWLAAQESEVRR